MGDRFYHFPLSLEDYFASYLLGFNLPSNDQASFQVRGKIFQVKGGRAKVRRTWRRGGWDEVQDKGEMF